MLQDCKKRIIEIAWIINLFGVLFEEIELDGLIAILLNIQRLKASYPILKSLRIGLAFEIITGLNTH